VLLPGTEMRYNDYGSIRSGLRQQTRQPGPGGQGAFLAKARDADG